MVSDVAFQSFLAPQSVQPGQAFVLSAWIVSPITQDLQYQLRSGDEIISSGANNFAAGLTRLMFRDRAGRAGVNEYTVTIQGAKDAPVPENNTARVLVGVEGSKPVLVVSSAREDSGLVKLLRGGLLDVVGRTPGQCNWSLEDLSRYSAVILENVPAGQVGMSGMETLASWVEQVLPRVDYFRTSDGVPFGGYIVSKFEEFVFDPMLRNIFGQKRSTVNLQQIMDSGKILLVNLAKGELSDVASRFLGMVLLSKLQAAAMGRVKIPLEDRLPFFVYVDEFQSIATQSFITMLSEGRKFGLGLVLANQFISQLKDRRITESIFGNVGSLICFRLGQADAESLEKFVAPGFSRSDLTNLPNWYSIMSTLVNGQTVQPFSIETELGDLAYDPVREQQVRAISRRKYSRSKTDVEHELGYQRK